MAVRHRLKPTPDMGNPFKRVGAAESTTRFNGVWHTGRRIHSATGRRDVASAASVAGHRLKPTPDMGNPFKRVGVRGVTNPFQRGLAYQPPNSFGDEPAAWRARHRLPGIG